MSNDFLTSAMTWLLHSTVAASVLMLLTLGLARLTRQPARRQRLCELGLAAALLACVAGLAPAWVVVGIPVAKADADPAAAALPILPVAQPPDDVWIAAVPGIVDPSLVNAPLPVLAESPPVFPAESSNSKPALTSEPSWTAMIAQMAVALYGVGVGFFLIRWLGGHLFLRRLLRETAPAPPEVAAAFSALPGRRRTRLLLSHRLRVPISLGVLRPTVILPAEFCAAEQRNKLAWVFAHELTHVERRDALSALLLAVGQAVFFHLPWFWRLRKQVRLCQEFVADASAVAERPADEYAEFLLSLTEAEALPLGATGVAGPVSDLFRRVTMLLQNPLRVEKRCPRLWTWGLAGTLLALAVVIGGIGLEARADDTIIIIIPGQKKDEAAKAEKPKTTATFQDRVIVIGQDKPLVVPAPAPKDFTIRLHVDEKGNVIKPSTPIQIPLDAKMAPTGGFEVMILPDGKQKKYVTMQPLPGLPGETAKQSITADPQTLKILLDELERWKEEGSKTDSARLARVREILRTRIVEKPKAAPVMPPADGNKGQPQFELMLPQPYSAAPSTTYKGLVYGLRDQPSVDLKSLEKLLEKLKADPTKVDAKEIQQALDSLRKSSVAWQYDTVGQRYLVKPNEAVTWATVASPKGRFGVRLSPPSADLREHLSLGKDQGIVIDEVYAGTPAATAGLKARDIILKVNNTPVPSDTERALKVFDTVKDGESADLTIIRRGKEETIKGLKLPARNVNAYKVWTEAHTRPLQLAEPVPEKGAVITVRRDGNRFTATHREKNVTITVQGVVKDGKAAAESTVVEIGGKIALKAEGAEVNVPEEYRQRVRRLVGIASFDEPRPEGK
jgi:beta-lactamase regulating signal transducer with metallopeptidase domain